MYILSEVIVDACACPMNGDSILQDRASLKNDGDVVTGYVRDQSRYKKADRIYCRMNLVRTYNLSYPCNMKALS